ncbi:MAG: redoxin domain-containing protein [Bacteroidaceae bacterium]|nr:redoxin domain-containing protein [Bacteroidaceae bacterium]
MKKIISCMGLALVTLAACDNTPKFGVEGSITDAEDKVLYLENVGLESVNTLDSIKLKKSGDFDFKAEAPSNTEFYRLRIEDKIINFSIDSTETVKINADLHTMPTDYVIEASEANQKIKELAIKQINLEKAINAISNTKMAIGDAQDSVKAILTRYKDDVKRNYIFKDPQDPSSYFALFQTVTGYLIFDPVNDKKDVQCFAAVATSWDNKFPHANRAINLHNIAIRGMKNVRGPVVKEVELDPDKIHETDIINISLPDIKGEIRNLTDLKGKVVLLDFTIYNHTQSAQRNMLLREIYDKYKDQGFEIFQISLDTDEHFWKTNADNLPWVCVRDANGIYSTNVTIYGVSTIPTFFLIDRDNTLNKRNDDIKDVETEIQKLL